MFENDADYQEKRAIVERGESVKVNGRFVSTVADLDVAYGAIAAQKAKEATETPAVQESLTKPAPVAEAVKPDDAKELAAARSRSTEMEGYLGGLQRDKEELIRSMTADSPLPKTRVISVDAILQFAEENPDILRDGETKEQFAVRSLEEFRSEANRMVDGLISEIENGPDYSARHNPGAEGEPEKAPSGNDSELRKRDDPVKMASEERTGITVSETPPQAEATQCQGGPSPEPQTTGATPLPADFPVKQKLEANGIATVEAVPKDRAALMDLPGIGERAADAILERMAGK
jgi:hypothetical protein